MTERKSIGVTFGAFAPKIRKQLREQGVKMTAARAKVLQELADATVALSVAGLLTDAERQRVRRRLVQRIVKAVKS